MKKLTFIAMAALSLAACGQKNTGVTAETTLIVENPQEVVFTGDTVWVAKDNYTAMITPQVDLSCLEKDAEGYYQIFNGTNFAGWRGYGKDHVPTMWTIEDGCLKFNGQGGGEAQMGDGGDIIFLHRFQNFELDFYWKVAEAANSGVFYLAQEIINKDNCFEPIYLSAPEYQILDNANHPDAKLGVDGNRMSASLYDMIPANPQNQKPWGEWNHGHIMVFQGTVVHYQNDKKVLEYHLWTPRWTEMLQSSKFSETAWPIAYELLSNCGGDDHMGYIGFQDHGDVVWYKNIRVKEL